MQMGLAPNKKHNDLGLTSFILGIICLILTIIASILTFFTYSPEIRIYIVLIVIAVFLIASFGIVINITSFYKNNNDKYGIIGSIFGIVTVVLGIIVIINLASAPTFSLYSYINDNFSPSPSYSEAASATVTDSGAGQIKILLTGTGENYDETYGYTDWNIIVEGYNVDTTTNYLKTGQPIFIGDVGEDNTIFAEDETIEPGTYSVIVVVMDSIIFDGMVKIS